MGSSKILTIDEETLLVSHQYDCVENAKALVILAHGAGADMDHDYIADLVKLMNAQQLNVIRFNFPYMDKRRLDGKRRPPDRMPKLIACYESILASTDCSLPTFIAGKSMGGRVAATIARDKMLMTTHNVKGVICVGYPFHPAKKPENLRLMPLQETQRPVLILQGDRDALGNKDEIKSYKVSELCQVHFFTDGDHDLKPRVKSGYTLAEHKRLAVTKMQEFINAYS